jgi:hypothetical protein
MAWKNCVKLGIVNSEEFVVNNFDDDKIYITREEGGEDLEIDIDDFHNLSMRFELFHFFVER